MTPRHWCPASRSLRSFLAVSFLPFTFTRVPLLYTPLYCIYQILCIVLYLVLGMSGIYLVVSSMVLLFSDRLLSAGHDVSDGGLITCLLEMAFAGNCGLDVEVSSPDVGGKEVFLCVLAHPCVTLTILLLALVSPNGARMSSPYPPCPGHLFLLLIWWLSFYPWLT